LRIPLYILFAILLYPFSILFSQSQQVKTVYGDRARIGCVEYYPVNFNPMFEYTEYERDINKLIFGDGLFTYDQVGNIINGLAESAEQENNGNWRIRLKSDIQFHDRSRLLSEDVKFSFDLYKKFSSEVPKLYQFRLVSAVEIIDHLNLRIILKRPFDGFKESLGQLPILPRNEYGHWLDYNYAASLPKVIPAVGTGYFQYQQESPENEIGLGFNSVHYNKWANLEGVDFVFFKTYDQMLDAYLSEKIDVIQIQCSSVRQKIYQILGSFNYLSVPRDYIQLYYINLNTTVFPFNDKEIRKALDYAINKSFIVDKYLENNAQVAFNILNLESK
jgi:peptide/nickel transport system substrate-binding protein